METVYSYKQLQVWKASMDLVLEVYSSSGNFPKSEIYGLTSQLRRCAVSIPSNIAEGATRKNTKEFIQFLYIANGSLSELETQLEIASRLGYSSNFEQSMEKIKYIRKMLLNLIHSLENKLK